MNILIVSFTFPPNKDGVSEAASAMALGLIERGWKVTVLTEETNPDRLFRTLSGIAIIQYNQIDGPNPEILIEEKSCSYADFLTLGDWDVILIHAYTCPLKLTLPVLDKIPAKKILVSHGYAALLWEKSPKFPYGLYSLLRRFLESVKMIFWMRAFDRIVYLSEQADFIAFYDHLIAKVTRYKGRRVIPNGVDSEERGDPNSAFRMTNGIPADVFVFLCVANYSKRKDQAYGVRAFRKAAIPDSVLVFIGSEFNEHSHRFQSEDRAHACAPGRIIWLEKQTRQSTLDALATCNAFLLSAYHEAQPIALLEAMRESKPWIARKAGCISQMEGGICVKSEEAMTSAMIELASNPALRFRLGEEGRQAVTSRYNRAKYVESYCKLIEELVPPPSVSRHSTSGP